MLFARIVLILAKRRATRCIIQANNSGGGLTRGDYRMHVLVVRAHHTFTRPRLAGAPRGGKSSDVLGSPLELKLLYPDYLS
jgi:hypothetical protein